MNTPRQERLRARLHEHLKSHRVFDDLRKIVEDEIGISHTSLTSNATDSQDHNRAATRAQPNHAAAHANAARAAVQRTVAEVLGAARNKPQQLTEQLTHLTQPNAFHLHLQLLGGRAFADEPSSAGDLRLSLQLGDARFVTQPVSYSPEPQFEGMCLLPLPLASAASAERPVDAAANTARPLSNAPSRALHLLVLQRRVDGAEALLSSVLIEWRKVLQVGRCTLAVELPGVGALSQLPVGSVEMRLELVEPPALAKPHTPLTEPMLQAQLHAERASEVSAERAFLAYARTWWADYLRLRDSHRQRPVKLFAMSELGVQRPVTAFVSPMDAGRLLDSPLAAAHFVSLIGFERSTAERLDTWHTAHSTLARKRGDAEEHALLLCSLLLGFGLDAYVCLGADANGPHAWVMTRRSYEREGGLTFWESLTGERFDVSLRGEAADAAAKAAMPFKSVACIFSDCSLYANMQPETALGSCQLALDDETLWKRMDPAKLRALTPLPQGCLSPPALYERAELERALELELRREVSAQRVELGGAPCAWDSALEPLLAPALHSYEAERLYGIAVGAADFEAAIRRATLEKHTFKGSPHHFTHADPRAIATELLASTAYCDVLRCGGETPRYALRTRVHAYPDDVLSVWVLVAVHYVPQGRHG